jgi:hypothetical protein
MPPKLVDAQPEALMPFDRTGQSSGRDLDSRSLVTRIKHQRVDIAIEAYRPVRLRLDVVIE